MIESNTNYTLGFVEFDDQGWFWGHSQWQAVKDQMEVEATQHDHGLVTVVFVHGWKNNAEYANDNVNMFRGVLDGLSRGIREEDQTSHSPPRRVVGVYIGWRGLSATIEPFKEFSFFARKNVAERLGHAGAATQVFTELQIMQEDFNRYRTNLPPAKLVFIGHSFGGAALFSATSQLMTEHLVLATRHKSGEPVKALGDLVILLNPALEASPFNNLFALATSHDIEYPVTQGPILAIFTSKTDTATKHWFPRGRWLDTRFERLRMRDDRYLFNIPKSSPPDQSKAILETIGNDQEFITYDLNYTNYSRAGVQTFTAPPVAQTKQLRELWSTNSFNLTNAMPYVFANSDGTNRYACILAPRSSAQTRFAQKPGNPFLNVSVDSQIVNGHGDISNRTLVNFLQQFILFAETNYSKAKRD